MSILKFGFLTTKRISGVLGINPKGMGVSDESTKSEKVVTVVVPSGEERFEIRINKKSKKGKLFSIQRMKKNLN